MISNYLGSTSSILNAGVLALFQSNPSETELAGKATKVFGKGLFEVSIGTTEAYGDIRLLEKTHPELRTSEGLKKLESAEDYAGVVNALADDPELLEKYQTIFATRRREAPQESEGSAVYNALFTVIMENRQAFPPGEFVLRVNLWDPGSDPTKPENVGSITSVIPSLSAVTAQNMPETMAAREKDFFDARKRAEDAAKPDPELASLLAMSKALKSLLVENNQNTVLLTERASEDELAKPFIEHSGRVENAA